MLPLHSQFLYCYRLDSYLNSSISLNLTLEFIILSFFKPPASLYLQPFFFIRLRSASTRMNFASALGIVLYHLEASLTYLFWSMEFTNCQSPSHPLQFGSFCSPIDLCLNLSCFYSTLPFPLLTFFSYFLDLCSLILISDSSEPMRAWIFALISQGRRQPGPFWHWTTAEEDRCSIQNWLSPASASRDSNFAVCQFWPCSPKN